MTTCLRSSIPCSSSSSPLLQRRTNKSNRALICRNSAKIPCPPLNPEDRFIKKLASMVANLPQNVDNGPTNSDTPPFMDDVYESPQLNAAPAQMRSASYGRRRRRRGPPDLESYLLDRRIVFIGMPFVPVVTELVIAQLYYLQWMDYKEPIHIVINSSGTTRDDGEPVAMETEGIAIYDTMMHMRNEINTYCIGMAMGQACLLLAAGTKGKRIMMPNALAMIQQPRLSSSGLLQASDVEIRAKEVKYHYELFVELMAKHTGNSIETVAEKLKTRFYMDCVGAQKFGVIDKIAWRGQEDAMMYWAPQELWDRTLLKDDPTYEPNARTLF